jgi:hypothetical protein
MWVCLKMLVSLIKNVVENLEDKKKGASKHLVLLRRWVLSRPPRPNFGEIGSVYPSSQLWWQ